MIPSLTAPIRLLASFLASGLLFSCQLLVAKALTPIYGGSPGVWLSTLLFFQVALLAGYTLSQLMRSVSHSLAWLSGGILVWMAVMPLPDAAAWNALHDQLDVAPFLLLTVGLGGLGVLLSTVQVTIQYQAAETKQSPWPLYGAANVGALAGLIGYAFVLSQWFTLDSLVLGWNVMLGALALLMIPLGITRSRAVTFTSTLEVFRPVRREWVWVLDSALATAVLMAVSGFFTQDIAPIPLLWVAPLTVFLIAFALPFAPRPLLAGSSAAVATLVLLGVTLYGWATYDPFVIARASIPWFLGVPLGALFFSTWWLTSRMFRTAPDHEGIGRFYFAMSLGGALGAAFVVIAGPLLFADYTERLIVLALTIAAVVITPRRSIARHAAVTTVSVALLAVALPATQTTIKGVDAVFGGKEDTVLHETRTLYGAWKVVATNIIEPVIALESGGVVHGWQKIDEKGEPVQGDLAFYLDAPHSPVPMILEQFADQEEVELGVVGMGAGGMNHYSSERVHTTFFEIDPAIVEIAYDWFSYVDREDEGDVFDVVLGDGRLSLSKQEPGKFDLLMFDAFQGEAVPAHLVTAEALGMYADRLADDGVMVFNTFGENPRLHEVIAMSARANDLHWRFYGLNQQDIDGLAVWVLVSEKPLDFMDQYERAYPAEMHLDWLEPYTWTDQYAPVLPYSQAFRRHLGGFL